VSETPERSCIDPPADRSGCAIDPVGILVAVVLDEGMLEALDQQWRRQGAPIAASLRPGLSDAEMEAIVGPLGVMLPAEARVWWGWHDGTSAMTNDYALGLDFIFLPLERAVAVYRQVREIALSVAAPRPGEEELDEDSIWDQSWFPLSKGGDGTVVACDCTVEEGAPSPIRSVNWGNRGARSAAPVADSLGTVVSWWIEALDGGAWTYSHERRRWDRHPDRIPDPRREQSGLV
jgi:cell wall assembly regulator SMI1